jgi:hypothetical protein
MVVKLSLALILMAVCVVIHAAGVSAALVRLRAGKEQSPRFWASTWVFVRLGSWIILLHLVEIAVWGMFYAWTGTMPGVQTALYFSAVTYTTTGYGDFVLPEPWRLVGGVEALTGILMCGWSTGFLFAVVHRLIERPGAKHA